MNLLLRGLALVSFSFLVAGCGGINAEAIQVQGEVATPESFDHSAFTDVLQEYVNEEGMVDYARLKETGALDAYLQALAQTDPSNLDEDERLAFWINAYNAQAIKLILDNYPVESIRRITPVSVPGTSINIPGVNDPFDLDFATIGGETHSLNDIEHGTIREEFDEPRIHFALVCAAMSCPELRREAYTGAELDQQLEDQANTFLHNEEKNQIPADAETIRLSKIFDWFGGDFGGNKAQRQAFLAPYFEGDVREKLQAGAYDIDFVDYDWTLNDQAKTSEAAASN